MTDTPTHFDDFEMQVSDDSVKTDLEFVHTVCGEHLADVQHDDTLATLINVASAHACQPKVPPVATYLRASSLFSERADSIAMEPHRVLLWQDVFATLEQTTMAESVQGNAGGTITLYVRTSDDRVILLGSDDGPWVVIDGKVHLNHFVIQVHDDYEKFLDGEHPILHLDNIEPDLDAVRLLLSALCGTR